MAPEERGADVEASIDDSSGAPCVAPDGITSLHHARWGLLQNVMPAAPRALDDPCPCRKLKLEHIDGVARP
jgi:hypothetical protein